MADVNDTVVFPGLGLVRITERVTKEDQHEYFHLEGEFRSAYCLVSEFAKLARPPVTASVAKALIARVQSGKPSVADASGRMTEIMEAGSAEGMADLLAELGMNDRDTDTSFHTRTLIGTAKMYLVPELAHALKRSVDEIEDDLKPLKKN